MKRKRDKTKGDLIDANNNDSNNGDETNDGDGESSSEMEIDNISNDNWDDNAERSQETVKEPPQETGKEPERVVTVKPDGVIQRPPPLAVYGRVRVKLKTATKPQPQPQPCPQPQPQPQSEPEPQRGVVEAKSGGSEGVSNEAEVDKSMEEIRVDKTEYGGVGSCEQIVVMESENLGSYGGVKSGGMGSKIVSLKSLSTSPHVGGNVEKISGGDEGLNNESEVDKSMEEVIAENMEDGGVDSGEKVVVAMGNSKASECMKPGSMGGKIVSFKSLNKSPHVGGNIEKIGGGSEGVSNGSEIGESMQEVRVEKKEVSVCIDEKVGVAKEIGGPASAENKKAGGMGIKIVSSKSLNLSPLIGANNVNESTGSRVEEERFVEENGNSGLAEGKKFARMGIKIVSLKSSNLSPLAGVDGNLKESCGGKVPPKADLKECESVNESGKSRLAEVKKSGGMGINIVSSRDLDSTPPGAEGNIHESSGGRMLPKADLEKSELVDGSGKLGSLEGKKSGGLGIKIVSSKSSNLSPLIGGVNVKESDEGMELPKADADAEEGELVEESGNSRTTEGKKFDGIGIKIVSSKSSNLTPRGGGNVKESSGSRVSPEADIGVGGLVEVEVKEEKPKSFNLRELESSLEVIKKVMRMDGAEPFNAPVNPIELDIPDYFDVIDTPMDFGTIRNNLESRTKYMDSEDVYKDAQHVWDNCFKYNNKGDYIVDLMKRVKKNFMKYWVAAGLYNEQTKKMTGGEGTGADEPTTSGNGKKLKKGKGYMLHKEDCLCAICIRRRRRREREAREAEEAGAAGIIIPSPRSRAPQTSMAGGYKPEENLYAESPGENTSSFMATSPGGDGDADMEDEEIRQDSVASYFSNQPKAGADRIAFHDKYGRSGDISETLLRNDKGVIELYSHDNTGGRMMIHTPKQPSVHPEEPASEYLKQRHEQLELEKKRQRIRLVETFRDLENPMLAELCGTLFPNNVQSVWNGANSLLQGQKSHHQKSGIHGAVASFIGPSCKSASSL